MQNAAYSNWWLPCQFVPSSLAPFHVQIWLCKSVPVISLEYLGHAIPQLIHRHWTTITDVYGLMVWLHSALLHASWKLHRPSLDLSFAKNCWADCHSYCFMLEISWRCTGVFFSFIAAWRILTIRSLLMSLPIDESKYSKNVCSSELQLRGFVGASSGSCAWVLYDLHSLMKSAQRLSLHSKLMDGRSGCVP